ncbi:hypothetical protein QR685DRAFT_266939 [Neurospora intermedia]|uniref:Uncharacterized protein n=1 Tax=Neurospora intermedia TaxID=5142 RepID=A0ABR3DG82_NEUIN
MEVERSCIVSYCNGFPVRSPVLQTPRPRSRDLTHTHTPFGICGINIPLSGESPTGDEHSPSPQNDVIITQKNLNTASFKNTDSGSPFRFRNCHVSSFSPNERGKSSLSECRSGENATDKTLGIQGGKRGLAF